MLNQAAHIDPIDADLDPLDVRAVDGNASGAAYICIDDDLKALQVALRTVPRLADPDASVVVEVSGTASVVRLVDHASATGRIRAFSVLDHISTT